MAELFEVPGTAPAPDDARICRVCGRPYHGHSGRRCRICREPVEHHHDLAACVDGRRRMALARQAAGVALDELDVLALNAGGEREQ